MHVDTPMHRHTEFTLGTHWEMRNAKHVVRTRPCSLQQTDKQWGSKTASRLTDGWILGHGAAWGTLSVSRTRVLGAVDHNLSVDPCGSGARRCGGSCRELRALSRDQRVLFFRKQRSAEKIRFNGERWEIRSSVTCTKWRSVLQCLRLTPVKGHTLYGEVWRELSWREERRSTKPVEKVESVRKLWSLWHFL